MDEEYCWICFDVANENESLERPCRCPRHVHRSCLARWQLQSAGKEEEKRCRFCHQELPDWKSAFKPVSGKLELPIVAVMCNGHMYKCRVRPGPEGQRQFEQQIKRMFRLPEDTPFTVTFNVRAPTTDDELEFRGLDSFDAVSFCASLAASRRVAEEGMATTTPECSQPRSRHVENSASPASSKDSTGSSFGRSVEPCALRDLSNVRNSMASGESQTPLNPVKRARRTGLEH